jgi:hypothetical protein
MGLTATLCIMAVAAALVLVARWRAGLPGEIGRVRHVPWTALAFLGVLVIALMGAHALTLLGLQRR